MNTRKILFELFIALDAMGRMMRYVMPCAFEGTANQNEIEGYKVACSMFTEAMRKLDETEWVVE